MILKTCRDMVSIKLTDLVGKLFPFSLSPSPSYFTEETISSGAGLSVTPHQHLFLAFYNKGPGSGSTRDVATV